VWGSKFWSHKPKGYWKCPLHTWLCLEGQEIAGKMERG